MKCLHSKYLRFLMILGTSLFLSNTFANDANQKYLKSINQMIKAGVLSEQEGKAQIGQLQIAEDLTRQESISKQTREITNITPEDKYIKFSNEPIEIQVK